MINLLVVDDYPMIRELLQTCFEGSGLEFKVVGQAGNGQEAINLAKTLRPDVVLMDVFMPLMDGITATHMIKANDPSVKVVTYSGQQQEDIRRLAMIAGSSEHFTKPFDLNELFLRVTQLSAPLLKAAN